MNWIELRNKLSKIAEFSNLIYKLNQDSSSLFDYLDNLPLAEKLKVEYENSTGKILSLRKKVTEQLAEGKIDRKGIENEFIKGKKDEPKGYTPYKNLFSILYPFIVSPTNDDVYNTLDELADSLRRDLKIEEQTETKLNGFDGSRNTGDTNAWFAIYNNTYPNQKKAKQLFFSIQNGKLFCAMYDRVNDQFNRSALIGNFPPADDSYYCRFVTKNHA